MKTGHWKWLRKGKCKGKRNWKKSNCTPSPSLSLRILETNMKSKVPLMILSVRVSLSLSGERSQWLDCGESGLLLVPLTPPHLVVMALRESEFVYTVTPRKERVTRNPLWWRLLNSRCFLSPFFFSSFSFTIPYVTRGTVMLATRCHKMVAYTMVMTISPRMTCSMTLNWF